MLEEMHKKPGKAVIDGVPQYTSVSAINRLHSCETSWWFRYVQGLPDPPGKAAQAGTEAHARIAHYLTTAEDVLENRERIGLEHMPPPKSVGVFMEHPVAGGLDAGGIPLLGGMDLLDTRKVFTVKDWKFKGEPEKYRDEQLAKGYELGEWLKDPKHPDGRQMLGYGEWVRKTYSYVRSARLQHVFFATKGPPRTLSFFVDVPVAEIQTGWHSVADPSAGRIRAVAAIKDPKDTKPNTNHCFAYYKACAFSKQCPHFGVKANSLFDFKTPAGPSEAPKEPIVSMLEQMRKLTTQSPPPGDALAGTMALKTERPSLIIDESTEPDEVVKARLAAKAEPTAQEAKVAQLVVESAERLGIEPAPVAVETLKRKRRTKSEMQAARAVEAGFIETAAPDGSRVLVVSQEVVEQAKEMVAETAPPRVVLYFGCSPVGVQVQGLVQYVDEIERRIVQAFKLDTSDIRLAKLDAFQFGRWKAILENVAIENPPSPGHYLVFGDERVDVVAAALSRKAGPGDVILGRR